MFVLLLHVFHLDDFLTLPLREHTSPSPDWHRYNRSAQIQLQFLNQKPVFPSLGVGNVVYKANNLILKGIILPLALMSDRNFPWILPGRSQSVFHPHEFDKQCGIVSSDA